MIAVLALISRIRDAAAADTEVEQRDPHACLITKIKAEALHGLVIAVEP